MFFKIDPNTPKVTPQWSQSHPKVTQGHPNIPKATPEWLQSDPKVLRLATLFARLAGSGPSWHLKKTYENQWFFNISAFWRRQARAYFPDKSKIPLKNQRFSWKIKNPFEKYQIFLKNQKSLWRITDSPEKSKIPLKRWQIFLKNRKPLWTKYRFSWKMKNPFEKMSDFLEK